MTAARPLDRITRITPNICVTLAGGIVAFCAAQIVTSAQI
jgi:hypothetical protein